MFALTKLQQYVIFIGNRFQDNIFSMKNAELSITIAYILETYSFYTNNQSGWKVNLLLHVVNNELY